jgi:Flp pilus assembly pilin Flp
MSITALACRAKIVIDELRRRVDRAQEGASLVEYALLLALIVVVAIGAIIVIGNVTSNSINNSAQNLFP